MKELVFFLEERKGGGGLWQEQQLLSEGPVVSLFFSGVVRLAAQGNWRAGAVTAEGDFLLTTQNKIFSGLSPPTVSRACILPTGPIF